MPTNLKIVPHLLLFAAAALVLFAVVNANAQMPTTRSVAIPPIPPGQARIWIYGSPQPTVPTNYPIMEAITLNGVKAPQPGHTAIAQLAFLGGN